MCKHPFLPNGRPVSDITLHGFFARGAVIAQSTGAVELDDWDSSDSFVPEVYTSLGGDAFVLDSDGSEYLMRHCRIVEVFEGFDYIDELGEIEAWPDEIDELCVRVQRLESGLVELRRFEQFVPKDFRNPVTAAVLDDVLRRHIQTDIAECEARIAAFRKGRVEVTKLEEPEEENVDAKT